MQAITIPVTPPAKAPAAAPVAQSSRPAPPPLQPLMPVWDPYRGWVYMPYPKPAEPAKPLEVAPKPADKVTLPKAKSTTEQAEDDLTALIKDLIRQNPAIKQFLTPERVTRLKDAMHDPQAFRKMAVSEFATTTWGRQLQKAISNRWTRGMFKDAALKLAPPNADPWVEEVFTQLKA